MTTTSARSRFLELHQLSRLAHKRFTTRQRVDGALSGRHVSRRVGGVGEFSEFREYSAGEDLRRLDWKVLGRTGKAYVKIFQDENNLVCTPVIDVSGSMLFGGRSDSDSRGSKLEYAQFLATALSHLIFNQRDQVGLGVIAGGLVEHLKPGGAPNHVRRLQDVVEGLRTAPKTDLASGLDTLFQRSKGRGVMMLMSDFLVDDIEAVFSQLRLFRQRHWEVILLHLVHPGEESLPEGNAFRFEGMENEGVFNCSPAEVRRAYQQRFEAHCAEIRATGLAIGCDYRRVSTGVPYIDTLNQFLVDRTG